MGIGDWRLGIGDWGLGSIPNPQSSCLNESNNNNITNDNAHECLAFITEAK